MIITDSLFQRMDEALVKSPLRVKINEKFVNELCTEIVRGFYKEKDF